MDKFHLCVEVKQKLIDLHLLALTVQSTMIRTKEKKSFKIT